MYAKILTIVTAIQALLICALIIERTPTAQAGGKTMNVDRLIVSDSIIVGDGKGRAERILIGRLPKTSKEVGGNADLTIGIAMFPTVGATGIDGNPVERQDPTMFLGIDRKEGARLYMGTTGVSSIEADVGSIKEPPRLTFKGRGYQPLIEEPSM